MTGQYYQPPPPQHPTQPPQYPQQYGARYEHADFVHRAVALIIDIIIIALIFLAVIVVSMIAVLSQIEDVESWAASINPEEIAVRLSPEMAIFSLLAFALVILYFTLQEGGPNNATVGKKLMHIKVVDKNYQSINDTKALVRNVMRLWFFPQLSALILLLDIVLILVRPEKQRIGDMVANTYVVSDRPQAPQPYYMPPPPQYQAPPIQL